LSAKKRNNLSFKTTGITLLSTIRTTLKIGERELRPKFSQTWRILMRMNLLSNCKKRKKIIKEKWIFTRELFLKASNSWESLMKKEINFTLLPA
jgi:hypothetical protein